MKKILSKNSSDRFNAHDALKSEWLEVPENMDYIVFSNTGIDSFHASID